MGFDLDVEIKPWPIPADPDSLWHLRSLTLSERTALAPGWNEFGGQISAAGERMRDEEVRRRAAELSAQ